MGNSRRLGRESSSTASVAALQCLPPVQRAALLLSDISGFPTAEIAEILGSTEESVEGALELARETLSALRSVPADSTPPPNSSAERVITSAFTEAFESGNVGRIEALLSDDAALELRPSFTAYRVCSEVSRFLSSDLLYGHRKYKLAAGRVDLRPTFACYVLEPYSALWHADGAIALTLRGSQIRTLTRFTNNGDVARFGFPLAIVAP
jgi:RNA polymerase sigma-70 factor, ECF subfamily